MSRKFYIAGVQFRPGAAKILAGLSEGDELDLVLEPTNKYDPNAVRIEVNGEHVGYVPKKFSGEISAMIEVDGAETVQCNVTKVDPTAKQWEMCEVEITSLVEKDDIEPEEFDEDPDAYREEDD